MTARSDAITTTVFDVIDVPRFEWTASGVPSMPLISLTISAAN